MKILTGTIVAALVVVGAVVLFLWPVNRDDGPPSVAIAIDELAAAEPRHFPAHDFWLVRLANGEFRAFYDRDPTWTCRLEWFPSDNPSYGGSHAENNPPGVFREGCGGAAYNIAGERVFGPTGYNLSEFPLVQSGDTVVVQTAHPECGTAHEDAQSDCAASAEARLEAIKEHCRDIPNECYWEDQDFAAAYRVIARY